MRRAESARTACSAVMGQACVGWSWSGVVIDTEVIQVVVELETVEVIKGDMHWLLFR